MAFVNRSERNIKISDKEESNVGPADYFVTDANTDNNNNNIYKRDIYSGKNHHPPFNSNKERKFPDIPENKKVYSPFDNSTNFPGPGAYIKINDNFIKKKSFSKNTTSPDDINKQSLNEMNPNLFISSEKRFTNSIEAKNNARFSPGPCQYDELNNFIKLKNRQDFLYSKNKNLDGVLKNSPKFLSNSKSRVISIPAKDNCYGYEEVNGKSSLDSCSLDNIPFQIKIDPNIKNKFSGEKNDSIGPDRYNIDGYYQDLWVKKGFKDWKKEYNAELKKLENLKNKKIENQFEHPIDFLNIKNLSNESTNESLRKENSLFKNQVLVNEGINILKDSNSNSSSNNYSSSINNSSTCLQNNNSKINNKLVKKCSMRDADSDLSNEMDLFGYEDHRSVTVNNTPGPGQYDPYTIEDAKKYKKKPSKFQNFGSSVSRSLVMEKLWNNGEKEDNNRANMNRNLLHSCKVSPSMFEYSKKSNKDIMLNCRKNEYNNNCFSPFQQIQSSKHVESFTKSLSNSSKRTKVKIKDVVGPGTYNPTYDFHRPSSNIQNFNSLEKRFQNKTEDSDTPDPGSYSNILVWCPQNQNKFNIKSGTEAKLIEEEKKLKDILKKLENQSPGVGQYSPEIISSIEYNCLCKSANNNIVPFSSGTRRFQNNNRYDNNCYLGPGTYEVKNFYDEKVKPNKAPFLVNEPKGPKFCQLPKEKVINKNENKNHKVGSYFDWNKKSYNILFN